MFHRQVIKDFITPRVMTILSINTLFKNLFRRTHPFVFLNFYTSGKPQYPST